MFLTSSSLVFVYEQGPAFMISHTGLQAVCPSPRNLNDEYLKRIVNAGGLVGITLFKPALCGEDIITSFVETVSHAAKVLGGVESIAIGSDWDGAITTSVSASTTHLLSSALLIFGNFSHAEVQSIMYDNAHRFFERSLPQ